MEGSQSVFCFLLFFLRYVLMRSFVEPILEPAAADRGGMSDFGALVSLASCALLNPPLLSDYGRLCSHQSVRSSHVSLVHTKLIQSAPRLAEFVARSEVDVANSGLLAPIVAHIGSSSSSFVNCELSLTSFPQATVTFTVRSSTSRNQARRLLLPKSLL